MKEGTCDRWARLSWRFQEVSLGKSPPDTPPLHPSPLSVGTDLGLCGIWMLLICPYVISMTHVTVWVTQSLAWGTSARPVELPTCLDPCLNRDSMTQHQGRAVLSVWLVSWAPGSFGFVAWQLRGKTHYPRQQCPMEGPTHRKGQPWGQPESTTSHQVWRGNTRAQSLFRSLVNFSSLPHGIMGSQSDMDNNNNH